MVTTFKANDGPISRDALGKLQCRFDGRRPRGTHGLDHHVELTRVEDVALHCFEEAALFHGERVQTVQELARAKVLNGNVNQDWVVVAIGEGTSPGEEVQVLDAVLVGDRRSRGAREDGGPASAVIAHV